MKVLKAEYIPPTDKRPTPIGKTPQAPRSRPPDKPGFSEHMARALGVAALAGFAIGVAVAKTDSEEETDE